MSKDKDEDDEEEYDRRSSDDLPRDKNGGHISLMWPGGPSKLDYIEFEYLKAADTPDGLKYVEKESLLSFLYKHASRPTYNQLKSKSEAQIRAALKEMLDRMNIELIKKQDLDKKE